jgi:hypothetical protein
MFLRIHTRLIITISNQITPVHPGIHTESLKKIVICNLFGRILIFYGKINGLQKVNIQQP